MSPNLPCRDENSRHFAMSPTLPAKDDDDDHDVRRANTARALAPWRRLRALHEATDTLHRAMCLAPYQPHGMVIAFVVDYDTFYFFALNRVAILIYYSTSLSIQLNRFDLPPPQPLVRIASALDRV
jgi:hypothetical protein